MDLERTLLTTPSESWRTARAIVFDWSDGPRQGMCQLEAPASEFVFHLLDERPTPDDLDDRLFCIAELPPGSVERAEALLRPLGRRAGAVWVPVWRFETEQARARAEAALHEIEQQARPTGLVIRTRDFLAFLGCWKPDKADGTQPRDWFAAFDGAVGGTA